MSKSISTQDTFLNSFRIINKKQLSQLIPYSNAHIQRLEQDGQFPKRIQLGPNRVGWSLNEVQGWIESKKKMRDQELSHADNGECK